MTHTTKSTAPEAATFTSNTMLSMREVFEPASKPGKPRDRKTVAGWIDKGRYPHAVQATTGRQELTVPVRPSSLSSVEEFRKTVTLPAPLEPTEPGDLHGW